jgi:hypothetical protein
VGYAEHLVFMRVRQTMSPYRKTDVTVFQYYPSPVKHASDTFCNMTGDNSKGGPNC